MGDYEDRLVFLSRYDSFYCLVGGVNHPKKIRCYGSDGRPHIQLVKGKDDLRQDAVMQQVFRLVNRLLARDDSRGKRLRVRQYNVSAVLPENRSIVSKKVQRSRIYF